MYKLWTVKQFSIDLHPVMKTWNSAATLFCALEQSKAMHFLHASRVQMGKKHLGSHLLGT